MTKKEVLTLIIGILIGAIITTGVFLVLKSNDRPSFDMSNFDKSEFANRRKSLSEETEEKTEEEVKEEE